MPGTGHKNGQLAVGYVDEFTIADDAGRTLARAHIRLRGPADSMNGWSGIAAALRQHAIRVPDNVAPTSVGGGDISAAWRVETESGPIFLKTGTAASQEMFAAEAEGLAELADARAIRVPSVLATGTAGNVSYLALEWLTFGAATAVAERRLGEALAQLHRTSAAQFGWQRDNFIGATPQCNTRSDDWAAFFAEHRLGFQLRLAASKGFGGELQTLGTSLLRALPALLADHRPPPSLLHGDLWGGNWAACDGAPVVFDPAVYYGDRETDLAMTRLFGGFGRAFYDAYDEAWPLPAGARQREPLYRLYHVLNHLNLFGGGYGSQACAIMRGVL